MKKLLIISALLPALLFGQQPKNVQVASGETFDENNIVVSAGGTRLRTIPIAWTSGNSTLSLTGNITLTGNVIANGIGGATVNGQVLLGNATSGDFQIGNISAGSGISLTPGPGTLQVSANQSLFQSVKVSGQNDIIATSPTANITIAATGGLVATTNNTTNTLTLDGSGISSGSLFNGFTTSILATESVPSGWSLTGVNGIPEHTAPDADYKVVMKMAGTVATPTFSPPAGAVASGTVITISSATSGVTFMTTNNTTDPSRSVGTAGSTWTINGNQTIESMGYKDGAYLIDSAVASATYTISGGGGASFSDDFNRTNESPLAGDWETPLGSSSDASIVSNKVVVSSGNALARVKTSTAAFAATQEASLKLVSVSPEFAGPAVLLDGSGNGYSAGPSGSTTVSVYKWTAGGSPTVIGSTISASVVQNDVIKLRKNAAAGELEVFVNGVSVGVRTDSSSPYTSGQPGFWLGASDGDDFTAADVP